MTTVPSASTSAAPAPPESILQRAHNRMAIIGVLAGLIIGAAGGYATQTSHNVRTDTIIEERTPLAAASRAKVEEQQIRVSVLETNLAR